MITALVLLPLIYILYLIIKWSLKFFLLLLVVLIAIGFFYNISISKKITETGEYFKNKFHHVKQDKQE